MCFYLTEHFHRHENKKLINSNIRTEIQQVIQDAIIKVTVIVFVEIKPNKIQLAK